MRSSNIKKIWCSSQDHGEATLQCSSLGPAHNISPKINKITTAGTVTKNDIWRAAIISITIHSWEQLTDRRGTLNITKPHNASTSRTNELHVYNLKQTTRKKRHDCVWDPVTNKKTSQLRGVNYSRKKSGKVFRHGTTQRKESTDDHGLFSQRRKLETYLHVFPTFLESATLSWWCNVLRMSTHCETQDERLLSYTIKINETKQSCQPRFRNKRPTNVSVISVYHKTTLCKYSADHRWDLFASKKTPCQPKLCATILHILVEWCSSRNQTAQTKR